MHWLERMLLVIAWTAAAGCLVVLGVAFTVAVTR